MISIARLDVHRKLLSFAGIGNAEARLWQPDRTERLTAFRGIVGVAMRSVRVFTLPLEGAWKLVLHTDGISARFDDSALVGSDDLDDRAHGILERWGPLVMKRPSFWLSRWTFTKVGRRHELELIHGLRGRAAWICGRPSSFRSTLALP